MCTRNEADTIHGTMQAIRDQMVPPEVDICAASANGTAVIESVFAASTHPLRRCSNKDEECDGASFG